MLNYPLPGQPAKVEADMGSDNAQQVHKYGGNLTGNQYKVLTHMAWVSYDRRGIPKTAKGRDGDTAQPLQFFGNAQTAALEALGNEKDPYVALKAWETAVRELLKRGLLRRIKRAIPHKQTAVYELNLEALESSGESGNLAETGREILPETGREILPVTTQDRQGNPASDNRDWQEKPTAYLQAFNSQAEEALSSGGFSSGVPRRHSPSPETSMVKSPRARETQPPTKDDASPTYDEALSYLGSLPQETGFQYLEQAKPALGAESSPEDHIIHAAKLAGWQSRKAGA